MDVEYATSTEAFKYYRCLSCDILFIDPVPKNRLDEIYPAGYYSFSLPRKNLVSRIKDLLDVRIFRGILKELSGNDLKVLDVGGGSGWQLNKIKAIDSRIGLTQIVDLDANAAHIAEKNGHQYYCGRIEDFDAPLKFDLVLLLNLIEHLDDPLTILKKIRSLLSPQGVVLIKTPNFESLDARIFRHRNWGGFHCPRHWILFNKESFTNIVHQAHLRVEEFKYTQGAPFWSISVLSRLKKRGVISGSPQKPLAGHPWYPFFNAVFAVFDFSRSAFSKTSQMFFILREKSQ